MVSQSQYIVRYLRYLPLYAMDKRIGTVSQDHTLTIVGKAYPLSFQGLLLSFSMFDKAYLLSFKA